jgi:hypothetical protein
MSAYLEINDGIAVLNIDDAESRFLPGWLSATNGSLDRIESSDAKAPPLC